MAEPLYDASDLSEAEKSYVALLEEASQVLGEELCLMALEEPDKMRTLCSVLSGYVKQQETLKQINQIVSQTINCGIARELHVLPFVAAFKKKTTIDLSTVFTENDCFRCSFVLRPPDGPSDTPKSLASVHRTGPQSVWSIQKGTANHSGSFLNGIRCPGMQNSLSRSDCTRHMALPCPDNRIRMVQSFPGHRAKRKAYRLSTSRNSSAGFGPQDALPMPDCA